MIAPPRPIVQRTRRRGGLSLVEVTFSIVIIGVMMVAALTTLSSVVRTREMDERRMIARTLGEMLMTEIMCTAYEDPDEDPVFGLEPNEVSAVNRNAYDDVDDFDGLDDDPVRWHEGMQIPLRDGWTREVDVKCVSPAGFDMLLPEGWDFGIKRIVVTVKYEDEEFLVLTALRGRTKD